jgi:hypothetical protein
MIHWILFIQPEKFIEYNLAAYKKRVLQPPLPSRFAIKPPLDLPLGKGEKIFNIFQNHMPWKTL